VTQRTDDDRLLHLVCFTAHQFYRLQDALIDILLKAVQNGLNAYNSVFKFFQVDITGIVRMTSCARYFKEGVGSSRPN
jgi:hypothetical protein